jgi:ferredoxin-NADP reductase/DMSO/TMAO reductase YedYZ heme-binding membrane subunit
MNQLPFFRALVVFNGAIPMLMLLWDTYRGQLGANPVNNALHITGILSLVFLFLSLLISPLKWVTGWGGWVAFRRTLGLYGFFYAVVHLVIYVGFDRALSLSSTLNEIWMRRFLQVGAVAILLMVPLAVTSTNAMIQRMGPKRWKLLHRTAYAAAVLGVLHYYMLVKSDVRQPLAFAGVLTLLLSSRVGRYYYEWQKAATRTATSSFAVPALKRQSVPESAVLTSTMFAEAPKPGALWKGELQIRAMFQETPDVKTFRLMAAHGGSLPFEYQAGQFVNIQLTIDGKRVNRSYTLASSPTRRDSCELSIKRQPMGTASRYLHDQVHIGDLVKVSGPSGRFTFTGHEASSVLLIAGGVGITPLMSITRYLTDRAWDGDIYFLIVAKSEQHLVFSDEILFLQNRFPQLHVCVTLTRCDNSSTWTGERGRVTGSLLQKFVPNLTSVPVYLCGPLEMMDATREILRSVGVPDSFVRTETFAGRKSGIASLETGVSVSAVAGIGDKTTTTVVPKLPSTNGPISTVSFTRSQVQTQVSSDTTILEAAERSSITLPFECRSGFCGQCRIRLIQGKVQMDCQDALSPSEWSGGWILACQARPQSHVTVDA